MARENVRPRRARPTIGFVSILGDHEIVNLGAFAIANAAREQGVNVILFPAQALRDPRRFIAQANVLYDLMGAEALDGLVFWSLDLEYAVGEAEFRKYCERYLPLPIVDFGKVAWGDWPGARIDNYYGMREVIAHLIDVHGYRRIAFIRGSQGHEGMEDRYRAYRDVLTEHGLPIEPDLVSPYTREWTVEEVERIRNEAR